MAIEMTTSGRPVLMAVHEAPPTVLTKAPPRPPAYTVEGDDGSTTIVSTTTDGEFASPLGSWDQLWPPSTVLNTPFRLVPTYAVPGVEGSVATERSVLSPESRDAVGAHVAPPSVLRATVLPETMPLRS